MMNARGIVRIIRGIILLLITGTIYSCSGIPNEAVTNYGRNADELISKINSNSDKIISVFSEGTVTVDSPEMYSSGNIEFGILKPDSIYIKIGGPFGISIARLNINSDKFIYYNVQENYVIKGSSTAGNLGAVLQVKISFPDIIKGFTGSFKINKEDYDSVAINDLSLIMEVQTFQNDGRKMKYFINKENASLIKVVSEEEGNHIEVDYENFKNYGDIIFPSKITIANKNMKQTVYLDLSNTKINNRINYQTVKYPLSARLIEWN